MNYEKTAHKKVEGILVKYYIFIKVYTRHKIEMKLFLRGCIGICLQIWNQYESEKNLTCILDTLWGIHLCTRSAGFGKNLFQTRVFRIGTIP